LTADFAGKIHGGLPYLFVKIGKNSEKSCRQAAFGIWGKAMFRSMEYRLGRQQEPDFPHSRASISRTTAAVFSLPVKVYSKQTSQVLL
jgi:hypothetical protein